MPPVDLVVTESFQISGRGTGVFIEGSDERLRFGQTLDVEVRVPGSPPMAASAIVEWVRVEAPPGERVALLIREASAEQIPIGTTIRLKGTT